MLNTFCHIFLALSAVQAGKAPVPAPADQKRAEKTVRDLMAKDYAVTDRAGKSALSKKLLMEATKTSEALEGYVLLRDAVDASASSHDFGTMIKALDQMTTRFEVVADEVRSAAFAVAKKAITTLDEAIGIADACLLYWERGMAAEDFDASIRWAKEAETFAKLAKDPAIMQTIKDMTLEAGESRRDRARAEAAKLTLAKTPTDEASYHELGSYLCFVLGKWAEGIPNLTKGPVGIIRDLAQKEFLSPSEPEAKADLALAWRAAGEKEKTPVLKKRFFMRGRYWQDESLNGTMGIARRKLEKKLFPQVVVQKATLTVGKAPFDVLKAVQETIDNNPASPIVSDYYTGGPFPGEDRGLIVEYTCGNQRAKETVGHWDALVLPGVSSKGTIHPQASHGFAIVSAGYGAGFKFTDVTEKARAAIPDGYTRFSADLAAIDPNPGQTKSLVVIFDCHGRRFIKTIKQGEWTTLMR